MARDYARDNQLEDWFFAHVVHRRTLQDRIDTEQPLKQREADRFERLILLVDRAENTFGSRAKALSWLKLPKKQFDGNSPLDYAAWESGFLAVLDQLTRIEHGIPA
jgi:putative toxin-antitoxin system antitoxin component (TIGR02293 family)